MRAPYLLRRARAWLRSPGRVCAYAGCPEPQVGYSLWCREHTDRVLAHRPGDEPFGWPRKRGRV